VNGPGEAFVLYPTKDDDESCVVGMDSDLKGWLPKKITPLHVVSVIVEFARPC
jgi:hypothetical protein